MNFQSEIRQSEISQLTEKVQSRNYGSYLLKIRIDKARAFSDKSITFDFPVTAIVGPNGGGKTTILGAAAIAYSAVKPSRFFAKSGRFDASMQNWKFEYELIERTIRPNDTVRRTASFKHHKWSREGVSRNIQIFGVSRTVPATERPEMLRFTGSKFDVPPTSVTIMPPAAATAAARILDKDISQFNFINIDDRGAVTLIAGRTQAGDAYSEFHFGAGESTIIRMVVALELMSENSLVLIEEIENGLHPVATVRLVEYLMDLAMRRKIQVIFSSHSNHALLPLPDKAIWAAVNGNLYQGKLDIASLRAISGQIESQLVIFVEDTFAKYWVEEILRTVDGIAMDGIQIHAMKGDGMAARIHRDHNINPSINQPSVCLLDGDSRVPEDPQSRLYKLPGNCPESFIFDRVVECLDDAIGELTVALLQKYENQNKVAEVIRSVANTNRDPHLLFAQVGRPLGLLPEARVREAFIRTWTLRYPEEVEQVLAPFLSQIPTDTVQRQIQGSL
ncbi:AAA family ATPase [Castellaniella ginsengisoli]|uniref:AAA family ATPase n=1 Tax=Castellaniella ginsengisoli TaxID=546114 RepID=A0AB39G2Z7_9BURK